jgi:hypothetical protein
MSPFTAALVVFAVDFGVIGSLMCLEGRPPWARHLAKSFTVNDSTFLPLFTAMAVIILKRGPRLHGFYTSKKWHYAVLCAGIALSISTEIQAMMLRQYSAGQEMSPSKIWHTLIYCIIFYWMVSVVIPVIVIHKPVWALAVSVIVAIGFLSMLYWDAVSPWPWDAHLEGHYIPWSWYPRSH